MGNEFAAGIASFSPIILMLVIFYFLLYRPQKKAQQARNEMLESLQVGRRVVTIGGIYGNIVGINGDVLILEIADNVEIQVAKPCINSVVSETREDDGEEA